jgi:hypothetical protein
MKMGMRECAGNSGRIGEGIASRHRRGVTEGWRVRRLMKKRYESREDYVRDNLEGSVRKKKKKI